MISGNEFYKRVGLIIRTRRKRAKLTQDELANRVGLTRTSIANIEAGRQQLLLHISVAIAKALNMPIGLLVPGSELETLEEEPLAGMPLDSLPLNTVRFIKKGFTN